MSKIGYYIVKFYNHSEKKIMKAVFNYFKCLYGHKWRFVSNGYHGNINVYRCERCYKITQEPY